MEYLILTAISRTSVYHRVKYEDICLVPSEIGDLAQRKFYAIFVTARMRTIFPSNREFSATAFNGTQVIR